MHNLRFLILLMACQCIGNVHSQVIQLREAQEIRKKYIGGGPVNVNLSKSLFVDPFIGTGGHGHTYPGASAPFGMMQLSPDTRYEGWDGCSGYHYSDSIIYGFSHTHLSGTGVPDYCDLLFVPQSGKAETTPGYLDAKKGYGSPFSHNNENASPGFYEVHLDKGNIDVKLTVGERSGMHDYTFKESKGKKYVLIDLDHRDKVISAAIEAIGKTKVSGHRISQGWANEQHFYFYFETSVPFISAKQIVKNGQHKLLLCFPEVTRNLKIKVGMSAVDEAGARSNLEKEIPAWSFDDLRAVTVAKWDKELGKINIQGESRDFMVNFYTALYHSYLNPNIFSDVDGRYRGRDNAIHTLENSNYPQYSVFSLWDTYRAAHPLFTITQQNRTNAFIHTFLRQFDQGKDLPVWELAANETECMIGYHSVSVIADAYLKNLRDYDAKKALDAMVFTSEIDELGKSYFRKNGFISAGDEPESVSKTLEYAYDDFCIAMMAKSMGNAPVHYDYVRSSLNFINLFDPKSKFMRARRGGMWYSPFDPSEVNFNYTEANSWQYSLYAPHAVDVLSELMGGKDSLEVWLDRLFTTELKLSGREQADITGLIGQYAHGNEPSHHMAYLYNYTNAPYKTQAILDRIQNEMYRPLPDGLSGNEDCGQMSAWFVMSAMGLYQVTPGHPFYDFGRPMMSEATIELETGKKIKIKAIDNSNKNKYIQQVTWNGKIITTMGISHETFMEGGELIFIMGDKPSKLENAHPGSALKGADVASFGFIAPPFFENEERIFDKQHSISIGQHPNVNLQKEWLFDQSYHGTQADLAKIEYRFTDQPDSIMTYTGPFTIEKSRSIEARKVVRVFTTSAAYDHHSEWVRADYTQRDPSIQLKLSSEYAHQYAASGPNTLIDGMQGGSEFRTGDYQGFFDKDIVAEVEFAEPRVLKEIGLSCLQDMKSWIFYPSEIKLEYSYDGVHYEALTTIFTNVSFASNAITPEMIPSFSSYVGPMTQDFYRQTNTTTPIRKIRVTAVNYGKCPQWHLGAGNSTWLFADELIFR